MSRKFVLLVMDYQPSTMRALPNADTLVAAVTQARRRTAALGGSVYFLRVGMTDNDYAGIPDTNKIFAGVRDARALAEGTPDAGLDAQIVPEANEPVLRKTRVSAFSTTDLHERLQKEGVQTIVLAGVSTSGVVLSTVRDAFDRDYRIVVLSDCCADPNPAVHDLIMSQILPKHAEVTTSAEFQPDAI